MIYFGYFFGGMVECELFILLFYGVICSFEDNIWYVGGI